MKKGLLTLLLLLFVTTHKGKAEDWTSLQHEVSLGYGGLPTWDLLKHYDNYFNPPAPFSFEDKGKFGSINVSYLYYPDEDWGVGFVYSYTNNDKYIQNKNTQLGSFYYSVHTIAPSFKYNWYNYKYVTLYSRVSAGIAIATGKWDYMEGQRHQQDRSTKIFFAYQASPIGIELGRQIAGFVEVGFGHMGTVMAGLRYRI